MAKKKASKGNTGFRNGGLFCFNCGKSGISPVGQSVSMAGVIMKQFHKEHENCQKTWEPPVNNPVGKTERENAMWWAQSGEQGISSKTMFNLLSRHLNMAALQNDYGGAHPSDPDDFRRCYLLLQAVPQWKEKVNLEKLKELSPVWAALVENWDKLTEMLEASMATESKRAVEMYDLMGQLGCHS